MLIMVPCVGTTLQSIIYIYKLCFWLDVFVINKGYIISVISAQPTGAYITQHRSWVKYS